MDEVLHYELSPHPPSLFGAKNILLKPYKAQLLEAIREYLSLLKAPKLDAVPKADHYVLDGGSLLRRLKWKEGSTYRSIAEMYASFTVDNYGKATVVFDGCTGRPSTKTMPISDGAPKLQIRLIYQLQHNLLEKRGFPCK